jgi:flagellar motor switch protein FliM
MAKILEQDDIDKLFSTGAFDKEPEPPKNDVKIYDFRHPDRLSKEQFRLLSSLMENFCRYTATFVSAATRSLIEMTVASIDQLTYNELVLDKGTGCTLCCPF